MRKNPFLVAIAVFLVGCAPGSDAWVHNQMGNGGNITVDEIDATKGLYRVSVMNVVDFGWSGDDAEDRQKAAKVAMKQICRDAVVISEAPIPMGSYTGLRDRTKYSMTMRCPNNEATVDKKHL